MTLTGTVRNVIDFGVFVDIGVHQDGLVHISQISNKYGQIPGGDIAQVMACQLQQLFRRAVALRVDGGVVQRGLARDPRDELPPPILRTDVLELKDLQPGMTLTGTVRNVIDFGVFVDIGVLEKVKKRKKVWRFAAKISPVSV